ncbi:polysaccharide biosynthesis protein [Pectobacterium carotovorum subsp. carotovorum]|nr:polysaccharide biosynthesis protein [Pectobacterium carotovorum subsp. carotovorum]
MVIKNLRNNGFFRSASVLVGGTAFAQVIAIVILPIITRVYSPEDFNTLAVYNSIISIIAVISCLRLDIAIPLPDKDEDAIAILLMSLFFCFFTSFIIGVALLTFSDKLTVLVNVKELNSFVWLIPIGVWVTGTYSALQYWATRKNNFKLIAKTRVQQSIGGGGIQLLLGWLKITPLGLLFGQLVNNGAGVFNLSFSIISDKKFSFSCVNIRKMKSIFFEYKRFPLFSTFEALANNVGIYLPIILIGSLAYGPEAGYLLLATKIMIAPLSLVGGATAQVYLSKAPSEFRNNNLALYSKNILIGLGRLGVGPLIFAGMTASSILPLIFGPSWERAGVMISWMTPWFIMQFLSSPISMALHVTNNQKTALYLQVVGAILRISSVLFAYYVIQENIVEYYALSGFVFYVIYFFTVTYNVGIKLRDVFSLLKKIYLFILLWFFLAVFLLFFLNDNRY